MKKVVLLVVLLLISAVCFAFGAAGCSKDNLPDDGDKSQVPIVEPVVPEDHDPLTNPDLKDITVYEKDTPKGFYVGNGKLISVEIDGIALAEDDYVVSGGWLVLTAASWEGTEVGEHTFTFNFENYDKISISVTVSETDPNPTVYGGDLAAKENLQLWAANSSSVGISYDDTENAIIVTKKAGGVDGTKNKNDMVYFNADFIRYAQEKGADCIRFEYKANDVFVGSEKAEFRFYATETVTVLTGGFDSFSVTEEWQTATIDIEQFFVANQNAQYFGLIIGGVENSTLTIKGWHIGTSEELKTYRTDNLLPNYGFYEDNITKWSVANTQGLAIGWEEGLGMSLTTMSATSGLWQRDGVVYTPVTFMKIARSAGYKAISFTVKADSEYADYVPADASYGKGLRVFSKMVDGRDDNWIQDGKATGVNVYGDFGTDGALEFTVSIVLDDFFALNENVKYLGLNAANGTGCSFYISDLQLLEEPEPEDLATKYGFNEVNSGAGGKWTSTSKVMGRVWDAGHNGMKITMNDSGAAIDGRYYVFYTDIAMLTEAQAEGYKGMSFKVSSDDGAFTNVNRGIRIYSKANSDADAGAIQNGTAGVYVYGDFGLAADTTEFTVTIDIDEFIALNEDAGYLGIVMNIPNATNAYFSDLAYSYEKPEKPEPEPEDLATKYGFNEANSGAGGKWFVASGGVMTRVYDADNDAMKVTMSNAGAAINGRYFVLYTPIEMLTEAQTAGYKGMSFKVSSADGAFTGEGRGIRIYSKANSGADSGAIQNGTSGVYVYGDYGLAADTTEFTVVIDIDDFIALNESAGYLGIVMNMPNATNAYFSDLAYSYEKPEKPEPEPEDFAAKYGFNEANSGAGGKWTSTSNVMGRAWDAEHNGMKITMNNQNAAINGRYYVFYTSIEMLTEAQTAGYKSMSFKVSSDNGAFTGEGRGIRIYSKANSGADGGAIQNGTSGVYVYGDYGLAADTTEFTVTIDIDEFIALNESAGYLGIVMNMPNATNAYFSDLTYSKS